MMMDDMMGDMRYDVVDNVPGCVIYHGVCDVVCGMIDGMANGVMHVDGRWVE